MKIIRLCFKDILLWGNSVDVCLRIYKIYIYSLFNIYYVNFIFYIFWVCVLIVSIMYFLLYKVYFLIWSYLSINKFLKLDYCYEILREKKMISIVIVY